MAPPKVNAKEVILAEPDLVLSDVYMGNEEHIDKETWIPVVVLAVLLLVGVGIMVVPL